MYDVLLVMSSPKGSKVGPPRKCDFTRPGKGIGGFHSEHAINRTARESPRIFPRP